MTWDVIGHEWAADLLRRHMAAGSVRHAYLFTGPDQVGKRTLALAFAKALNCEQPPSPGEPCGQCRPCRQLDAGSLADLSQVALQEGESEIKIDQVRELLHQLALAPHDARRRIALLVDFDKASSDAQNALLKTLEEPGSHVVLLLTAQSTVALLATIVSRCEVLNLRPVPVDVLEDSLEARGKSSEQARLLAAVCGGRPGRAQRLASDPEELAHRTKALDDLSRMLSATRVERFAFAEACSRRRSQTEGLEAVRRRVRPILETWLTIWHDALLLAHGAHATLANPDRPADLERMAGSLDRAALAAGVRAVETALENIDRYANVQLALEVMLLDLPHVTARP